MTDMDARTHALTNMWVRYCQLAVQQRQLALSHVEAFCLMNYTDKNDRILKVWNSRDGVAPYALVASDLGIEDQMLHVDWHLDLRDPLRSPQVGDLVLVDCTPDLAIVAIENLLDSMRRGPQTKKSIVSRDEALLDLASEVYCAGIPPHLVKVTAEMRCERGWDQRPLSRFQEMRGR